MQAAWPGPHECPAFTFELAFHALLSSLELLDIQEKPQENQRWLKMLTHVPNVGTYTQEALGGFSVILLIKLLEKEPLLGRDIQQLACNFSTVLLHS